MDIKEHTVKSYDKDLKSISGTLEDLLDLLNHSIDIVENVIEEPKGKSAKEIIHHDNKINNLDNLTEKKVTAMLALRQPLAFDLRYIVSALKVSSNLERMGDKCKSIVKKIIDLDAEIDSKTKKSLMEMLAIAKIMTVNAVEAFNSNDLEVAEQVLKQDDEIDQIYHRLFDMIDKEIFSGNQVKNIINILFIAKNLERLADHSTNIAEMVKYVVSGEVIED
jgi:phosphate transport system protein